MANTLDRWLLADARPAAWSGLHLGEVLDADTDTCRVILPAYSRDVAIGPCRYPRPTAATTPAGDPAHVHALDHPAVPPAGTACVVAWLIADGVPRPHVITFYGWPA